MGPGSRSLSLAWPGRQASVLSLEQLRKNGNCFKKDKPAPYSPALNHHRRFARFRQIDDAVQGLIKVDGTFV
jgi:hypothetical protein